jgi:hypothetical protein
MRVVITQATNFILFGWLGEKGVDCEPETILVQRNWGGNLSLQAM